MHLPFDYSLAKPKKQVRVCKNSNRTLLFLLQFPLKIIQRLDVPQALSGDGAKGQRAEKLYKKDFRYVIYLPFAKGFQYAFIAPIIDGGFAITRQGNNLLHCHHIFILFQKSGVVVVHLAENFFG